MTPPPIAPEAKAPEPENPASALWESAVEAFVSAIIVSVLGSVAVGLVGGIFEHMAPSLPPFLAGKAPTHNGAADLAHAWWRSIRRHGFAILWVLFFVQMVWARLRRPLPSTQDGVTAWTRQTVKKLSKDWFDLIVRNAFGALISAMVLMWVQQFSLSQMVLHWLLETSMAGIQSVASHFVGAGPVDTVGGLFSWYGENQFKFTFWVLYIAAICDDLGLPNFKTLARRGWKWVQASRSTPPTCQPDASARF